MAVIISIAADKGGVGKTTLTYALSQYLAKSQHFTMPVLAVDMDPQANLTKSFLGIKGNDLDNTWPEAIRKSSPLPVMRTEFGVDILPADISLAFLSDDMKKPMGDILKEMLSPLQKSYAIILLDCPPGASNMISYGAMMASDYVLLPTQADDYGMDALENMCEMVRNIGTVSVLGIIVNLYRKKGGVLYQAYSQLITEKYGDLVLQPLVRQSTRLRELTSLHLHVRDDSDPKVTDVESDLFIVSMRIYNKLEELLDDNLLTVKKR